MDVLEALRRRRMTRAFDGTELEARRVAALCAEALRAPTAGHARGVEMVVLAGADGVARYLDAATDEAWRAGDPRAEGLAAAGCAVVVLCDPGAYLARYGEPDKSASGLAEPGAWPVPYWYADAGMATMALLMLAESEGLAACFLGAFRREAELAALLGTPAGRRVVGTVLLGGAASRQRRAASLDRPGPARADRVLLGGYGRLSR